MPGLFGFCPIWDTTTARAVHVLGMDDKEREIMTNDLRALFTELRRLGYLDDEGEED